jgi:hypothetical protein
MLSPTSPVDPTWPSHTTQGSKSTLLADDGLSYDALDDLQNRHDRLMQDIVEMFERLEAATLKISGSRSYSKGPPDF